MTKQVDTKIIRATNLSESIGFGCVKLSTFTTQSEALRILRLVYEAGIRWFDTAPLYGQGFSEKLLGTFIKQLPPQDRGNLRINSKFGLGPTKVSSLPAQWALPINALRKRLRGTKPNNPRESAEPSKPLKHRLVTKQYIQGQFESTMRRLRVDRLDAYLGHELTASFLTDEAMLYLQHLRETGEVNHLGVGLSAENILRSPEEFNHPFTFLQYGGDDKQLARHLFNAFPHHRHVHHSIYKKQQHNSNNVNSTNPLEAHFIDFPHCSILFSSSNPDHIRQNLAPWA